MSVCGSVADTETGVTPPFSSDTMPPFNIIYILSNRLGKGLFKNEDNSIWDQLAKLNFISSFSMPFQYASFIMYVIKI